MVSPSPAPRTFGDWLYLQGVSTVLLCGLVVGAWTAAPRITAEVRAMLEKKDADCKAERAEDKTNFTAGLAAQQKVFENTLNRVFPQARGEAQPGHDSTPPGTDRE